MKKTWKDFENDCYNYLTNTYGTNCTFEKLGESDSTQTDIKVTNKKGSFFIEVKEPKAQCGQFVLFPDIENKQFNFSNSNKSLENEHTSVIINHINNDFDMFKNAGTKGTNLDINQNTIDNWVIDYYINKSVEFFMTKTKNNDYLLIPTNELNDYFNITAKYRTKKSGSSSAPQNTHDEIIQTLQQEYSITNTKIIDKKLYVFGGEDLNKTKFKIPSKLTDKFYLSAKDNNKLEVKKLSLNANMNVIFSISLKNNITINNTKFENKIN